MSPRPRSCICAERGEGFNELGSRVGAARATALLARALLELDRLDEAASLADPAVGGDDLKATIGLLGVRAEVLARRNDVVEAERLARRAVEIASGTDALLDHADARLALSRVLAAAGRAHEAAAEAARARDLYEAKGSLVGVRRAVVSPTTALVDSAPDKVPAKLDDALALADTVTAGVAPSVSAPTPTATTRFMEVQCEEMARADESAIAAASAPGIVVEDRRPLFQSRVEGRAAHVANMMLILPRPGVDVRCESLATRGERLALVRLSYIGRRNHVEMLNVCQLDETEQRLVGVVVFEPEQEDAAYVELDERAVALGGEQWAGFRVVASWADAYGTGDVELLRDCFVPDAVIVDHRPARFGAATRDEFADLASELFALAESTALRIIEVTAATERATVFRMRTTGRIDGGSFENESWASGVFAEGRLRRLELFSPEGRADAEASLVASVGSLPAPNGAIRLTEQWVAAMSEGDAATVAALCAPDMDVDDRRRGLRYEMHANIAISNASSIAATPDLVVRSEPIATRGDPLALVRLRFVHPLWSAEALAIHEVSADGSLMTGGVIFDADDEDGAYAELDRRAVELGGPGVLSTVTVTAAYGNGDVALLRACCVPDAVIVDHRPALFGAHGVEEFLERTTSLLALTTSTKLRIIEIPIDSALGSVSRLRTTGLTADGGLFESERWSVGMIRDGRLERLELFPADARAEAEARYGELARGHDGLTPNAAARHLERWCAAINRGDVDAISALHTPNVVTFDRRRLVGSVMDAAETVANAAWLASRRDLEIHYVLLATRGDRLALARQEYRHPLTQVEAIALHEVTADGALVQCGVIFDVEDEDAAYAELDARAAALETSSDDGRPAENAASRHAERFHAAVSSGDAAAIGQLFAPDTVVDDRRRLVGIRMSPESSFESARLLAEFDGLTLTGEPVATRGQRLVLLQQQFVHRSRAVVETVTVHEVDESGERLDLAVMFDPEDEDAAWEELDARALALEGDILRPLVGCVSDYNTHDVDRLGAWFHPDCVSRTTPPWGGGRSRRRSTSSTADPCSS